ncbi:MAG: preprotein translocase subunit SecG [Owenweeksia sp.]|nr:preprotein translocase subunit SecG [Owenweeksia sp.]
MTLLFTSLIIIACILLVVIILVRNAQGGGLSSSFGGAGGGTQLFGGVKKTTDFLDRGTWTLAIVLVVMVLAMNVMITPKTSGTEMQESEISDELNQAPQMPSQSQPPVVPWANATSRW